MKRASAILMLLCCFAVSALGAQPGWLPRTVHMGPNLKGADLATAMANLESIERLLKQVPELAHPEGFEIRPFFDGIASRTGLNGSEHADYVIEYRYRIHFFYPKLAPDVPAIGAIVFMVNGTENMHGMLDKQGRVIFVEEGRWPSVPFSVVTYGVSGTGTLQAGDDFTSNSWFTAGREFPWRAVSREEYYNYMIAGAEGNNGERRAEFEKRAEKTPYQHWLEEAPQRKKDREQVLKTLAQVNPAEAVTLRKTMEDAERDAGEQLKKSENEDRQQNKSAFGLMDTIRAELNRMTPAQRKLPAIVDPDPTRTEWRATGASMRERDTLPNTPTVHRVLTPNYDFWRARHSRAEVRTILVHFEGTPNPVVMNAIYQAYKKFNWGALAAMLDQRANK